MKYSTLFRITASDSFDVEVHNFLNSKGFTYTSEDSISPDIRAIFNDCILIDNKNYIYYTNLKNTFLNEINISFNILKYCISEIK